MSGAEYSVVPDALEQDARRLEAAAHAVRHLREHPGVLRGRALDTGDPGLASALVAFARAWDEGLESVASEASRWAVMLRAAEGVYRGVEAEVATSNPFSVVAK